MRYKYHPPGLGQLEKMDGIGKPPCLGGHVRKGLTLICYPAHLDSHRDFILHILVYVSLLYLHTQNE